MTIFLIALLVFVLCKSLSKAHVVIEIERVEWEYWEVPAINNMETKNETVDLVRTGSKPARIGASMGGTIDHYS